MIHDVVAALLAAIVGFVMGIGTMYGVTFLVPVNDAPGWAILAFAVITLFELEWLRAKFGIGDYDEPDDYLPSSSTIIKAEQAKRVDDWNNGINKR